VRAQKIPRCAHLGFIDRGPISATAEIAQCPFRSDLVKCEAVGSGPRSQDSRADGFMQQVTFGKVGAFETTQFQPVESGQVQVGQGVDRRDPS
jgi:hypothetical protein